MITFSYIFQLVHLTFIYTIHIIIHQSILPLCQNWNPKSSFFTGGPAACAGAGPGPTDIRSICGCAGLAGPALADEAISSTASVSCLCLPSKRATRELYLYCSCMIYWFCSDSVWPSFATSWRMAFISYMLKGGGACC